MIKVSRLRALGQQRTAMAARSLQEARSRNMQTAFLSHSHKDQTLAIGLQKLLSDSGWDIYIDWLDREMPVQPNKTTAEEIQRRIRETEWFLFLATRNSTASRWCPWEIGYADATKTHDRIIIVPTEEEDGSWHGNEYLQLYRHIDTSYNRLTNRSGYAVYSPGTTHGTLVEYLR